MITLQKRVWYTVGKTALLLLALSLLLPFAGCFFGHPTEIEQGFSAELVDRLKTGFGVTIPDGAVFEKGLCTNSFRDPFFVIIFTVPLKDGVTPAPFRPDRVVFGLLSLGGDWFDKNGDPGGGVSLSIEGYDGFCVPMEYGFGMAKDPMYASVSYSFPDEHTVRIRFCGKDGFRYP